MMRMYISTAAENAVIDEGALGEEVAYISDGLKDINVDTARSL